MDRVERCVLGFLDCPERPLIVSNFGYMNIRLVTSGEAIWLYPVVRGAPATLRPIADIRADEIGRGDGL